MTILITCQEVVDLAFSELDQMTQDAIKETKIVAAQEKWIRPFFGEMYNSFFESKYTEFINEFIKPALAYYVRYSMLPDISVQIGNNGLQNTYTEHTHSSSDKQREVLRMQALDDANSLVKIAIRYVEDNHALFPEYKPSVNENNKQKLKYGLVL